MKTLRTFLGFLMLASLLTFGPAGRASAAGRIYVKWNADGANNGTSWANAYTNLKTAINHAASGDEIWVAAGTYKPGALRSNSFPLIDGVAIYGGFRGTETQRNQRDPAAFPTILSGEIGAAGIADNSYHVVTSNVVGNTTVLDGFTITGGNANGAAYTDSIGGGMYNTSLGEPSVSNVTFSNNTAKNEGGGMWSDYSDYPRLTNVTFNNNSANNGGGLYLYASHPIMTNVTFSGNSASNNGGGMYNYFYCEPTLTNVTFSDNTAGNVGGGMYNVSSATLIKDSIFWGNGTEIAGDPVTINDSLIQGGCPSGATCGGTILNSNPLLGALADNGGFTKTMAPGTGSPAIDAGNNATCATTDQRGVLRPKDGDSNGSAICDMGGVERTTNITANFRSTGAQDGWVLESSETSNTGGSMDSTGNTFNIGDDSQDRQYRAVLSFNTASLPDNAEVVWVTLKIRRSSTVGTDPFTTHGVFKIAIRGGYFYTQPALQLQDFQAAVSNDWVGTVPNTPVNNWYTGNLIGAAYPFINRNATTQFRLSFAKDDDDDTVTDYLRFFSGNYTSASLRPLLQVVYYVP